MTGRPELNGYAESFVATIKRECLNYFFCISLSKVDYIVSTFVRYYNSVRPHQGDDIGNNVLDSDFRSSPHGTIKCDSRGWHRRLRRCASAQENFFLPASRPLSDHDSLLKYMVV
ncbi:MAG: transposase [Planctomycetes bacterium]|nr:transposase [Planctomycetota bacterium]